MGLRKVYLIVHCQQAYAKGIFFLQWAGGGGVVNPSPLQAEEKKRWLFKIYFKTIIHGERDASFNVTFVNFTTFLIVLP